MGWPYEGVEEVTLKVSLVFIETWVQLQVMETWLQLHLGEHEQALHRRQIICQVVDEYLNFGKTQKNRFLSGRSTKIRPMFIIFWSKNKLPNEIKS